MCDGEEVSVVDVHVLSSLSEIDATSWDALLGADNPFVEHAFLQLLETSGSVGEGTGWVPLHLVVKDGEKVVGAAPCYLKGHSYGEYIFDWQWAQAAMDIGIPYYPKLVVAVPFTPATGPRLLVHPEANKREVQKTLLAGLHALMPEVGAHSAHILFCLDDEAEFLEEQGLIRRATHQYHWRNDGYQDFDAFLQAMRSSARKQIRRERRRIQEAGYEITEHRGETLSNADWRLIGRLYASTCEKKWGSAYLTEAFFEQAKDTVGERALVVFAARDGKKIAGTLSFQKGAHLYGRYWGALEETESLHFELCYYRLLERAINEGTLLVEAGAQGEHKIKRGFVPVVTHSAHFVADPGMQHLLRQHVARERKAVETEVASWQASSPFKEDAAPSLPLCAGIDLRAR